MPPARFAPFALALLTASCAPPELASEAPVASRSALGEPQGGYPNYGERVFLSDHLDRPFSSELISYLSTEHRKAYFFGNATPNDIVEIRVEARVLPPGSFAEAPGSGAYRTPLKFLFRIDLYRGSDKVLMASSLVRKALNVPGSAKGVLADVERFLRSTSNS